MHRTLKWILDFSDIDYIWVKQETQRIPRLFITLLYQVCRLLHVSLHCVRKAVSHRALHGRDQGTYRLYIPKFPQNLFWHSVDSRHVWTEKPLSIRCYRQRCAAESYWQICVCVCLLEVMYRKCLVLKYQSRHCSYPPHWTYTANSNSLFCQCVTAQMQMCDFNLSGVSWGKYIQKAICVTIGIIMPTCAVILAVIIEILSGSLLTF